MRRQTHLHLGCPDGEYIFSKFSFWGTLSLLSDLGKKIKNNNNLPQKNGSLEWNRHLSNAHSILYEAASDMMTYSYGFSATQWKTFRSDAIVSWTKLFENKNNPEYPCMANRKHCLKMSSIHLTGVTKHPLNVNTQNNNIKINCF